MGRYVIRRILTLIPILVVVSFLVFWLMSFTGDPALALLGEESSQERIEEYRESMGLNDPILVRYGRYMWGVFHGDFGKGLHGEDVFETFLARIPYTLVLAAAAMVVTVVLSIPLGILAAVKQNTWFDTSASAIAIAGISVPDFWLGLMMMMFFAVNLGWLPTSGATEGFKSLIMPAVSAGIGNAALVERMTRSSMVDQIRADYLRTARAKGAPEKDVILKHALKNALIPVVTIVGSQFSILMGGTVVTEMVFSWPGVGYYLQSAIRGNDYNMVTGFVVLITVFIALVLLAVDILYAFIDPRIMARYKK